MDSIKTARIIVNKRQMLGLTQKQLADYLCVTYSAVSKWERGMSLPDVALLVPLCNILGISVNDLLDDNSECPNGSLGLASPNKDENSDQETFEMNEKIMVGFHVSTNNTLPTKVSPKIFGHNLEHTRAAINGGLSAQMIKNRKFAGKPSKNEGVAARWFGIGKNTLFLGEGEPYTRHIGAEKMHRDNELWSQVIQNLEEGQFAGIGQYEIAVTSGKSYECRIVSKSALPISFSIELTDRKGTVSYAKAEVNTEAGDWVTSHFSLIPSETDSDAAIRITFNKRASVQIGAVSMMPADNFHGMRSDVVENLKKLGVGILRWPGGNFAGEYRWKDGLLPADMRGPLGAYTEIETQPYSDGYDYHEISTDDFLALCRYIGAEPFLTINLVWTTPAESAEWVEYCNGSKDSEYGKIRAERGHEEPYSVKYWSLGNEMGYAHMEGPMTPVGYASLSRAHAEAMLNITPDLRLFSSGPYPNDDWAAKSAAQNADLVKYISLHHYNEIRYDYTTEESIRNTYKNIISQTRGIIERTDIMRYCLDKTGKELFISFDEWNMWYSWYRPSSVGEGIYAALVLHYLIERSDELKMPVCCYFQPVGEGAITVDSYESALTASGQAFSIMSQHAGGTRCAVSDISNRECMATIKDGVMTVTLINTNYSSECEYRFNQFGKILSSSLYSSEDVLPRSVFTESELALKCQDGAIHAKMPPHSIAVIKLLAPADNNI